MARISLSFSTWHVTSKKTYELAALYAVVAPEHKSAVRYGTYWRPDLGRCLKPMSDFVRDRCGGILRGDRALLNALDAAQQQLNKRAIYQDTIAPVKNGAYAAWQRKDYQEAARLYGQIEVELTDLERRRLGYCQTKLGTGQGS
jgi:hypothetical protein